MGPHSHTEHCEHCESGFAGKAAHALDAVEWNTYGQTLAVAACAAGSSGVS
jgi:hypothetical protein